MGKRNKNDKQTRQTCKKKFQPIIWLWPNPYPVIRNPVSRILIPHTFSPKFPFNPIGPRGPVGPWKIKLKKSILKVNTTESEITTCPVPKVVHRGESRNLRWVEGVHRYYPTNLYPFLCSLAVALARTRAITHAHTYKYSHTRTRESGSWEANATLSWQKSLIRQLVTKLTDLMG